MPCFLVISIVVTVSNGQEKTEEKEEDLSKRLLNAARLGSLKEVRRLLAEEGADPTASIPELGGATAIHIAAGLGHADIVRVCLEAATSENVDVDSITNDGGDTLLMMASTAGKVEVAKLMLENFGAAVDATNEVGATALHYAAYQGNRKAAKLLLDFGSDVNAREKAGFTPLHYAAVWGHNDVMKLLLKQDQVEVDARDARGETALFMATFNGHLKTAEALVLAGKADPMVQSTRLLNFTSVHLAAYLGRTDLVKLFVEEGGANPMAVNVPNLFSPLFLAAESGHLDTVEYLISRDVNFDQRGNGGVSPLMYAAHNNRAGVVQRLLDLDVNVNARAHARWTPLIWAAKEGHAEMVRLLMEKGHAIVELKDSKGRTALHYAAWDGGLGVTSALVNLGGAAVDARDEDGRTPLHLAATSGDLEVVRWLVEEAGADPAARDAAGDSPVAVAAAEGESHEVLMYLVDKEGKEQQIPESVMEEGEEDEESKNKKNLLLYQVFIFPARMKY